MERKRKFSGNEEEVEKLRSTLLKVVEDNKKLQKELERSMEREKKYKQVRDEAREEVDRLKSQLEELTKRNQ
jgi:predicted  nucleic acid-binding Zn-ribbon protein